VGKMAPDDLRAYMRKRVEQFEKKKGITDEMGGTRSDFCDATGVNKTALGFMERLNRMTPEVRGDVLRSIDVIREGDGAGLGSADGDGPRRRRRARGTARAGADLGPSRAQAGRDAGAPADRGLGERDAARRGRGRSRSTTIESAPMPGDDFLGEVA
jgi:hypothetical protein